MNNTEREAMRAEFVRLAERELDPHGAWSADTYDAAWETFQAARAAPCPHQFHHFGTEQPRRRCVLCNELEA